MNPRLRRFLNEVAAALGEGAQEAAIFGRVSAAMTELVGQDDWLPPEFEKPHPEFYQQYLLHRDSQDRFSVVSFVWGPVQKFPIHDHNVWGVIGMLRGSEYAQSYRCAEDGMRPEGLVERLLPGHVEKVSPTIGDIHQVSNAYDDRVSISIHVHGTDIGKRKRHAFDPATGVTKDFVSGYANAPHEAT